MKDFSYFSTAVSGSPSKQLSRLERNILKETWIIFHMLLMHSAACINSTVFSACIVTEGGWNHSKEMILLSHCILERMKVDPNS
jgi:hypothetical protein